MEIYKYTTYVNHNKIIINKNITDEYQSKINNIIIDTYPNIENKAKKTQNNIYIKFYRSNHISTIKDITYSYFNDSKKENYDDVEIFLIKEYLIGNLNHPYFYDYKGITEVKNYNKYIQNEPILSYINLSMNDMNDTNDIKKKSTIGATPIPSLNYNLYGKNNKIYSSLGYNIITGHNIGILMESEETLDDYLQKNKELDKNEILKNIYNIVDLCIYIKDKYGIYHCDIKTQNILVKDNTFYLIDWENIFLKNEIYQNKLRPNNGNTEMYPHYDVTCEEFVVYSIGVLIIRILGYHSGVGYIDFVNNIPVDEILDKIPDEKIEFCEELIINIFTRKIVKIEELKTSIENIINPKNGGTV
jgi:hypothetical protein